MHILLLEDDTDLGRAVADHLGGAGHEVSWCQRIAQAGTAAPAELALLDLKLPDGDALALLRAWRQAGELLPVIVLTARDQVSDRIRGLQAGADDYLVKPFDLDELLARIAAVSRRSLGAGCVVARAIRIDVAARDVRRDGERVDLTAMEWAVLACLARRPGRIYGRAEIDRQLVLEGLGDADSNSIEVIVSRLRKKIGSQVISTHRGLGYRLET